MNIRGKGAAAKNRYDTKSTHILPRPPPSSFPFSTLKIVMTATCNSVHCPLMRPELSTWNSVVDNFPPPFGAFGPFDEHLCPSGGKTRTAKNTDGSDLHLLSAKSNRAYHLLIPLYEGTHRRKDPAFWCSREGRLMKDILTPLLASVFVLFSLIVLLSAARTPDHRNLMLDNGEQKVSDLGLRFAFKR